jgi:hypothetical protein
LIAGIYPRATAPHIPPDPSVEVLQGGDNRKVYLSTGGLVLGLGFMLLDSTVFAVAVLIAIGNGLMWPLLVALLSEKAGEIGRTDVFA